MATKLSEDAGPKIVRWAGYVVSTLAIGMLLFSATMKLAKPELVGPEFKRLGYDAENIHVAIGIVELACTIVYAIPQTAVLGAILLTGYLGGATATHVRLGEGFWGPVIGGVLVWLGLVLRDPRVRQIIPIRFRANSSTIHD
jgi:DoxX-like family